jgi:hypothetical protein
VSLLGRFGATSCLKLIQLDGKWRYRISQTRRRKFVHHDEQAQKANIKIVVVVVVVIVAEGKVVVVVGVAVICYNNNNNNNNNNYGLTLQHTSISLYLLCSENYSRDKLHLRNINIWKYLFVIWMFPFH